MKYVLPIIFLCFLFSFCAVDDIASSPKPRQYPKIEFPEKKYDQFRLTECPFSFELPNYAYGIKKDQIFNETLSSPCWFNLIFPGFGAQIYFSYYPIDQSHPLPFLIEDSYTMASKHNVKASFREEIPFVNNQGSNGLIFKIEGPVASPIQFYISDKKSHFLRGSLYYEYVPNQDSISIVSAFLYEDIQRLLSTLNWN